MARQKLARRSTISFLWIAGWNQSSSGIDRIAVSFNARFVWQGVSQKEHDSPSLDWSNPKFCYAYYELAILDSHAASLAITTSSSSFCNCCAAVVARHWVHQGIACVPSVFDSCWSFPFEHEASPDRTCHYQGSSGRRFGASVLFVCCG